MSDKNIHQKIKITLQASIMTGDYSNFLTIFLSFKGWSTVDSAISIIVKTVFVLMLLFDVGKVCRTKIFTKK